jgi:predicted N-formylglutamate amidohydrolase
MESESGMTDSLIAPDEPAPVYAERRHGRSSFVILVDHASARIPRRLGDLGVPPQELRRHIAWDIGALAVARLAAETLDAALIAQNYSRLVIDCNRDPTVPTSIPTVSELTEIAGNRNLTDAQKLARRRAIFDPYHDHISALLAERIAAGRRTIVVAQHSMTDVFKGIRREMHAAVLYNRDARFAHLVLGRLRGEPGLIVGDNQPYFVSDETDYTIPRHGERTGLPHVEIEIRQDLLADEPGQREWAARIASVLQDAELAFYADARGG